MGRGVSERKERSMRIHAVDSMLGFDGPRHVGPSCSGPGALSLSLNSSPTALWHARFSPLPPKFPGFHLNLKAQIRNSSPQYPKAKDLNPKPKPQDLNRLNHVPAASARRQTKSSKILRPTLPVPQRIAMSSSHGVGFRFQGLGVIVPLK